MYKKLVFGEFFNDETQKDILVSKRKIALSLISPKQIVHAVPIDDTVIYHLELSLSIICDIYNISKPFKCHNPLYIRELIAAVDKYVKEDERNFIIIRYILLRANRIAYVEFPYYITEYEYEQMSEMDKLFQEYEIVTHALIHKYDPINGERLIGEPISFEKKGEKTAIKKSLDYFQEHSLINNYDLMNLRNLS